MANSDVRAEVRRAYRDKVKKIDCPNCGNKLLSVDSFSLTRDRRVKATVLCSCGHSQDWDLAWGRPRARS